MDAPETTWQALQSRLTAARVAVHAGDSERALAEIAAALDIDPDFLAAQLLRERIIATPATPATPSTETAIPRNFSEGETASEDGGRVSDGGSGEERPSVPGGDLYAKFEQRAKRRRVDRRLDAARAALDAGNLEDAGMAIDELIELDPNLPELVALIEDFDRLRRAPAAPRRGPGLVAASIFVSGVLAASWLQDSTSLMSRSMVGSSPLMAAPMPAVTPPSESTEADTTVEPEAATIATVIELENAPPAASPPPAAAPADAVEMVPPTEPAAMPALRLAGLPESPAVTPAAEPVLRPALHEVPPAPVPARTAVPLADLPEDHVLVTKVLQRYRTAYEGLDAQSAQAVWPAVNQAALARAFNGLESQTLTFDACDVRVEGESATASCQGSARYVPKIGSREPRVEPRIWNFTLQKNGGNWKIDSARTER